MEPQAAPPPTPTPSHTQHHYASQPSPCGSPSHYDYTLSEKEYQRQLDWPPQRGSKGSNGHGRSHDSVISHPFSPRASSPPSPSSSISSAARKHRSIDEIHPSPVIVSFPPQAHLDSEKGSFSPHSPPSRHRVSASNPDVAAVLYDSGEYHEKGPEEKAVRLLLFLSGPCALLSFAITLWTLFSLVIALLLQPLRLCVSRPSLSAQLITFLAPPLNLQLHLVYSFSSATNYSASMLVVIHLLSPFVALGVALSSWTSAFFWFFSAILGDPAGQDGHNDGKESILSVRNWWDRWLTRALR